MPFADQRRPYQRGALGDIQPGTDPLAVLAAWMQEARDDGDPEPTAMALATIDPDGTPAVRYVLCKRVTDRGVSFYTGLESRKGRALAAEPRAAATFWWPGLQRSVRIVGVTERLPRDEVNAYFASRPHGSRLGAWSSHQSEPITDRVALERQAATTTAAFHGEEPLTAPEYWGGYELIVTELELWHGREDRLHDRLRFTLTPDGTWNTVRLQP